MEVGQGEIDRRDVGRGGREFQRVGRSGAAIDAAFVAIHDEGVGARAADQRVVSAIAVDRAVRQSTGAGEVVRPRVAGQRVIRGTDVNEALDIGVIRQCQRRDVGVDRVVAAAGIFLDDVARIVDIVDVVAGTAFHRVGVARAAIVQNVADGTAGQVIAVRVAGQRVRTGRRADDVLDVDEHVAIGVAGRGLRTRAAAEVDRDAYRARIARRHVRRRRCTDERIRAATAGERVETAGAARQNVGVRVTDERVVAIRRARHVLDVAQNVAAAVAGCRLRAGQRQVDGNGGRRVGVIDQIGAAAAAIYRVVGGAAVERIVTAAADEGIGVAVTIEVQTTRAARGVDRHEAGDRRNGEAGAHASDAGEYLTRRVGKIDVGVGGEHQGVVAPTATDGGFRAVVRDAIVAAAAQDRIRAAVSVDRVAVARPRDQVGFRGAGQRRSGDAIGSVDVLEVANLRVRDRDLRDGLRQVDGEGARAGEHHRVDACARVDTAFGAVHDDAVVARAADYRIVAAVTVDGVAVIRAVDDVRAAIALQGEGGRRGAGVDVLEVEGEGRVPRRLVETVRKIDREARLVDERIRRDDERIRRNEARIGLRATVDDTFGTVIGDHIGARAAADRVVAAAAVERVGEIAATQAVVTGRAGEDIDEAAGTDHVGDAADRAVADEACRVLHALLRQVERDRRRRIGIVDEFVGAVANDRVVAGGPHDGVITERVRVRLDVVGVGAAGQQIVAGGRADDVIDTRELVEIVAGQRRAAGDGIEIDRDRARDLRIVHEIVAAPAADDVTAEAADERVVAKRAGQDVRRTRARDLDAREGDAGFSWIARRHVRQGQIGRVDVLEAGHIDTVADGLVGAIGRAGRREIDIDRGFQTQRVIGAEIAGDRDFGALIIDDVVRAARINVIAIAVAARRAAGAATAGIAAAARRHRIDDTRETLDDGQVAVDGIGELVRAVRQIEFEIVRGALDHERVAAAVADDRAFGPVKVDEVITGTARNRIATACAVDGVAEIAALDAVVAERAGDDVAHVARAAHVLEVCQRYALQGACAVLRDCAEIDGDGADHVGQIERVDARAAVQRIVPDGQRGIAAQQGDRVVAEAADDGVVRGRADDEDALGEGARVEVIEARNDRAVFRVLRFVALGEVYLLKVRRELQRARCVGIRRDQRFGAVVHDGVVAARRVDDIVATTAVDRGIAG